MGVRPCRFFPPLALEPAAVDEGLESAGLDFESAGFELDGGVESAMRGLFREIDWPSAEGSTANRA